MGRTLILDSIWLDADRANQLVKFLRSIETDHLENPAYDRAIITAEAIYLDELVKEKAWQNQHGQPVRET